MENELQTLRGQILGLVGALNAIAAVLPNGISTNAVELLTDMVGATKDNGLPPLVTESMHSTMHQIKNALQVPLYREEGEAAI